MIKGKPLSLFIIFRPNCIAWRERNAVLKPVYINLIYKALRDDRDKIVGIMTMGYDVTEHVMARKKIEEAGERTRLAVDAAMLGTFEVQHATDKVICSPRFFEIPGLGPDQQQHPSFIEAIHPDDLAVRNAANEFALQTGVLHYEARVIWPDKSIHWISEHGHYFFDSLHKPQVLMGVIRDITTEKEQILKIKENEQKIRNTLMQDPVGITILGGDFFTVEMANETFLKIIDSPEADLVGKAFFEKLPELRCTLEPILTPFVKKSSRTTKALCSVKCV